MQLSSYKIKETFKDELNKSSYETKDGNILKNIIPFLPSFMH